MGSVGMPQPAGTDRARRVRQVEGELPGGGPEALHQPLFVGRRRWVERTCESWFILSGKYGLVAPEQVVAPYDETLARMSREERRAWSRAVVAALRDQIHDRRSYTFEIHAGAAYFDFGLRDSLVAGGAAVEIPSLHPGLGEQLALYGRGPRPNG